MKNIQIDDDLYHFIASKTQHIGESASDILRRLVMPDSVSQGTTEVTSQNAIDIHSIHENYPINQTEESVCQAQQVFDELQSQQLLAIPKMVERWLLVLSIIYKYHNGQFGGVLGMSGRNRTYFATDKETLLATGSSTNPKNVPGSEYWVITNNNTAKKINMLKEVAEVVGFSGSEIERLVSIFAPELVNDNND